MNPQTVGLLLNLCFFASGVFTLYGLYFAIVALFGFKKNKNAPKATPTTRFAVLIAARNEEGVIGNLVDSLQRQNYPKELYDIIVAPNNCTDKTEQVARQHGAQIFNPEGTITSKGQVLEQIIQTLLQNKTHDAICVFDADNLVHPDFLAEMNNTKQAGSAAAQGFRDSKNPVDTAVSTSYSICYWMVNRFYNSGRNALGLSGLINGSGFMVSMDLLSQLGGWNTCTMTEDYEFTAQCVLVGKKIDYVPSAIIYDEQPLTFTQSWKQRRRWSTGSLEGMELYLTELIKHAFVTKSWVPMDLALTFVTPLVQLISLVLGVVTAFLGAYGIARLQLLPISEYAIMAALCGVAMFTACTLLAAFVVWLNRGFAMRGASKGILYFAFFLISWLPISILSIFKRQKNWDSISHTCSVKIDTMENNTV